MLITYFLLIDILQLSLIISTYSQHVNTNRNAGDLVYYDKKDNLTDEFRDYLSVVLPGSNETIYEESEENITYTNEDQVIRMLLFAEAGVSEPTMVLSEAESSSISNSTTIVPLIKESRVRSVMITTTTDKSSITLWKRVNDEKFELKIWDNKTRTYDEHKYKSLEYSDQYLDAQMKFIRAVVAVKIMIVILIIIYSKDAYSTHRKRKKFWKNFESNPDLPPPRPPPHCPVECADLSDILCQFEYIDDDELVDDSKHPPPKEMMRRHRRILRSHGFVLPKDLRYQELSFISKILHHMNKQICCVVFDILRRRYSARFNASNRLDDIDVEASTSRMERETDIMGASTPVPGDSYKLLSDEEIITLEIVKAPIVRITDSRETIAATLI